MGLRGVPSAPPTITHTLCLSPDSGAVSCHLWNVETFL